MKRVGYRTADIKITRDRLQKNPMFSIFNELKRQAENYSMELETIKSDMAFLKRNQINSCRIEKYSNQNKTSMERFNSAYRET